VSAAIGSTICWKTGREVAGCAFKPKARFTVVFFNDNLFVYRNGNPDNPVFSTHGRP
jgi:hypothetical protein